MNIKTVPLRAPKQDIFKSGKFRSIVIQSIVMILFVSFVLWVINNTATNMTANGIAHGLHVRVIVMLTPFQQVPVALPLGEHPLPPFHVPELVFGDITFHMPPNLLPSA